MPLLDEFKRNLHWPTLERVRALGLCPAPTWCFSCACPIRQPQPEPRRYKRCTWGGRPFCEHDDADAAIRNLFT